MALHNTIRPLQVAGTHFNLGAFDHIMSDTKLYNLTMANNGDNR